MTTFKLLMIFAVFLPLLSASPTGSSSGPSSRPRRPSLHEILRRNQNIAAVVREPSSKKQSTEGRVDPVDVHYSNNRRSILFEREDDTPNYVFDDEIIDNDTDFNDVSNSDDVVKLRRQRDDSFVDFTEEGEEGTSDKSVGDRVTQEYAKNYGLELPSYADPNFLAAVMNQADEANFRYPVENKRAVINVKDQSSSGSAKIETYADPKMPDLNPYELFPPSFHELLDIPIHVYRNGSTYNPHDKFKNKKNLSPTITKGYSSTNVNGNVKSGISKVGNKIKPQRIDNRITPSPFNPLDYFESKKISSSNKLESSESPDETAIYSEQMNEEPLYIQDMNIGKNPSYVQEMNVDTVDYDENLLDTESENFSFQKKKKNKLKTGRPSLRFRTDEPPTVIRDIYATTPEIKEETATTPRSLLTPAALENAHTYKDQMLPHSPSVRTAYGSQMYPENTKKAFQERPIQQFDFRPIKDGDLRNEEILNPTHPFNFKEEDDHRKGNLVPSHFEGSERESDIFESNYQNFENYNSRDRNSYYNVNTEEQRREQTPPFRNKEKDSLSFIDQSNSEGPNYYEHPYDEPEPQKDKEPKFDFKPSKRDPYVKDPSFTHFSNSKIEREQMIIPTTFRPLHSLSIGKAAPPAPTTYKPPSNVFLSESSNQRDPFFKSLQENQENLYQSSVYNQKLPFTNSHSRIKPFKQYTISNRPQERREPQLERAVPVYISSPIHKSVELIQREFDRFGQHSGLSSDLKPPPTYEYRENTYEDRHSHEFTPSQRVFSPSDNDRQVNSNNKPSFFEKFGFFRPRQVNRNGVSPSKPLGGKRRNRVEYVLTNGPAPMNGKKVVVVGPFKEPPIGAPVFIPESDGLRDDNEGLYHISSSPINSVRKAKSTEDSYYQDDGEQEPALFKFETNNIYDNNESRDIVVQSQFEVGDQNQIDADRYKQGNVASVNRFSPVSSKSKVRPSIQNNNNGQELKSVIRSAVQVSPQNYNFFEEVSEEDKNRLIAAKFKIPRISSIRRSGLQRHIIPIPVPLMTSSGEQVLSFRNIHVPNSPIAKKQGRLLNTDIYNSIEEVQPKERRKSRPHQKHLIENKNQKSETTLIASPPTMEKPAHETETFDKMINSGPPQSYREPSASEMTFGGWQAVGNSPIKSYVRERSPFLTLTDLEDMAEGETYPETIAITNIEEEEQ